MKTRTYRIVMPIALAMVMFLACLCGGCSESGTDGNGNGNGELNGDSGIVGEIVGILTYTTSWDYMPPNNTPVPRTTLDDYHAALEDEDGRLYLLSSPGMYSDFEYDGGSLSAVTTTVAGYTYTDEAPFNDESRDVDGQSRVISHTGITVSVKGYVDTVTGYISGDAVEVDTITETG